MNLLDILLLVAALSFAVSGYRQGFVIGVLSFAGFLGGGFLGMALAPELLSSVSSPTWQALASVVVVFAAAMLGQVVAILLGGRLRSAITWRPARAVDSTLGALLSVVSVLLVAWFVASALRTGPLPSVSAQIRGSAVITEIDQFMPDQARGLFSEFRQRLGDSAFPRVFGSLSPETILPVDPPTETILSDPDVRAASDSIVKVRGRAVCARDVEGTGFVVSPGYVLTNAHVVAGVRRPTVQVGGTGARLSGRVVVYDANRDLAMIHVPGLKAPALAFGPAAERGDEAVVAGFPLDGPYRLSAARVRQVIDARGPNIYGTAQVTREVYSVYAAIQPGNSGGPMLDDDGRVSGVVFAKSVDDDATGYVLTRTEVDPVLARGKGARTAVSTGACAA